MKPSLLLIIPILFGACSSSSENPQASASTSSSTDTSTDVDSSVYLLSSVLNEDTNANGETNDVYQRTHDANGNITSLTTDSDNDGESDSATTYTHDSNNLVLTKTLDTDNDGDTDKKYEYSYDEYKTITALVYTTESSQLTYAYTNTYDSTGLLSNQKITKDGEWYAEAAYTHGSSGGYYYELVTKKDALGNNDSYQIAYFETSDYYDANPVLACLAEEKSFFCEKQELTSNDDFEKITGIEITLSENATAEIILAQTTNAEELMSQASAITVYDYAHEYDSHNNPLSSAQDTDGDGYFDLIKTYKNTYSDGTLTTFTDSDSDGFPNTVDCDDTTADTGIAQEETCDSVDNDCDGQVDEGFDTDGNGTADCNDIEVCDGLDNNGDGSIDEDVQTTYYKDSDGDGYGRDSSSSSYTESACSVPTGYAANREDCDDNESSANPAQTEVCDGIDNDCDGTTDEGFDSDGDGKTDCKDTEACDGLDNDGDGQVDEGFDADGDGIANCYDTEACDGLDNDGDGSVDEGVTTTYYVDDDDDGYGDDSSSAQTTDACSLPTGYAVTNNDCNDSNSRVHPERRDCGTPSFGTTTRGKSTSFLDRLATPNSIDDDCDGEIDEDC